MNTRLPLLTQSDVTLRDGRRLAYAEYGDRQGRPVLLFHGTPGSRLFHHPDVSATASAGARIIAIDRPGFGQSHFAPHRKILDWADDVTQLADALGLGQFAVLGYGGGGPYAAACAHAIPNRLTAVGLVSSIAPLDDPQMTNGMHGMGHVFFSLDRRLSPLARLSCQLMCGAWKDNPDAFFKRQVDGLQLLEAAQPLLPKLKLMLVANLREATRTSTDGVVYEFRLLSQPWGFQPGAIKPQVLLWHGEEDTEIPVAMGQHLAKAIPHCRATFFPGEGHWAIYMHWREILTALLANAGAAASPPSTSQSTRPTVSVTVLPVHPAHPGQELPLATPAADPVPSRTSRAGAAVRGEALKNRRISVVEVIDGLADDSRETTADAPPRAAQASAPVAEEPAPAAEEPVEAPPEEALAPAAEEPVDAPPEEELAPAAEEFAPTEAPAQAELPAWPEEPSELLTEASVPAEEPAPPAEEPAEELAPAAEEPAEAPPEEALTPVAEEPAEAPPEEEAAPAAEELVQVEEELVEGPPEEATAPVEEELVEAPPEEATAPAAEEPAAEVPAAAMPKPAHTRKAARRGKARLDAVVEQSAQGAGEAAPGSRKKRSHAKNAPRGRGHPPKARKKAQGHLPPGEARTAGPEPGGTAGDPPSASGPGGPAPGEAAPEGQSAGEPIHV